MLFLSAAQPHLVDNAKSPSAQLLLYLPLLQYCLGSNSALSTGGTSLPRSDLMSQQFMLVWRGHPQWANYWWYSWRVWAQHRGHREKRCVGIGPCSWISQPRRGGWEVWLAHRRLFLAIGALLQMTRHHLAQGLVGQQLSWWLREYLLLGSWWLREYLLLEPWWLREYLLLGPWWLREYLLLGPWWLREYLLLEPWWLKEYLLLEPWWLRLAAIMFVQPNDGRARGLDCAAVRKDDIDSFSTSSGMPMTLLDPGIVCTHYVCFLEAHTVHTRVWEVRSTVFWLAEIVWIISR
jgi:hypothetical protein